MAHSPESQGRAQARPGTRGLPFSSPRPLNTSGPPRRRVPALSVWESPGLGGHGLRQQSPPAGRALTTETQPAEPEAAARRSSGITMSLSCRVRVWSTGSCSIGPWKRARRLGSAPTNQRERWLSRGRVASGGFLSFCAGSSGAWEFCAGLRLLCRVSAGRGFVPPARRGEPVSAGAAERGPGEAVLEEDAVASDSQRSLRVSRSLRGRGKAWQPQRRF